MKKMTSLFFYIFAALPLFSQQPTTLSKADAEAFAIEIYIYGYPLVTMDMTRAVMTNTDVPKGSKAPMGQFANLRTYPDASFKDVTAPNADTLYSSAWLDLSKEPYILHLPDENGRYYLMPMLSGWTNVFASLGTRTTGTKSGDYAITGPGWRGKFPKGVTEVKSPTNLVWIIGRTYSTGTPEDYEAVHKIQDQYSLTPLSSFGKPYSPPKGTLNPSIDMKTPVRDQVNQMDAATYFKKLARLMRASPPTGQDVPIITKMRKIGIIPGREFAFDKLDPKVKQALEKAPKLALQKIMDHLNAGQTQVNGWEMTLKTGIYGKDYLQRALVAAIGLGANLPQDAVYPVTEVDSQGNPLNGTNNYVLHFPKEQTPPIKGFWSLTMYDKNYFFVSNPLNRYSLSPRNQFEYNQDGSLDLYIQNASPGAEKESNWLPAPKGDFILMLRLYWPEESLIQGKWKPPAVQKN